MAGRKLAVFSRGNAGCGQARRVRTNSGTSMFGQMRIAAATVPLETEFQTQAELPFINTFAGEIRGPGDGHEVRSVADKAVRVAKVWCVGEVERLRPELQPETLGEREFTKQ